MWQQGGSRADRASFNSVGVDPGKRNILTMTGNRGAALRYTTRQRVKNCIEDLYGADCKLYYGDYVVIR